MASSTNTTTSDSIATPISRWPRGRGKDDGPKAPRRLQEIEEFDHAPAAIEYYDPAEKDPTEKDSSPEITAQDEIDQQLVEQYCEIIRSNREKGYRHRPADTNAAPRRRRSPWWAGTYLACVPFYDPLPADFFPISPRRPAIPHQQPDMPHQQPDIPHQSPGPHAPERKRERKRKRAVSPDQLDDIHPQPIPDDIMQLVNTIKQLPITKVGRSGGHDFPSRNTLRTCAALNGETSRKTGCLRLESRGGRLRKWKGDERLFSASWWEYLCVEHYEKGLVGKGGEGEGAGAVAEPSEEGSEVDEPKPVKRRRAADSSVVEEEEAPAKRPRTRKTVPASAGPSSLGGPAVSSTPGRKTWNSRFTA